MDDVAWVQQGENFHKAAPSILVAKVGLFGLAEANLAKWEYCIVVHMESSWEKMEEVPDSSFEVLVAMVS